MNLDGERYSAVAISLRKRAERLRHMASMTLVLILLSLFAGLSLFIAAGWISQLGVGSETSQELTALTKTAVDLKAAIEHDRGIRREENDRIDQSIRGAIFGRVWSSREYLRRFKDEFAGQASLLAEGLPFSSAKEIVFHPKLLTAAENAASAALDTTQEGSNEAVEKVRMDVQSLGHDDWKRDDAIQAIVTGMLEAQKNLSEGVAAETMAQDSPSRIASTMTTRIGSILLLIFLVQILVTMYRYCMRLASYYDARADLLEVSYGGTEVTLQLLAQVLFPETIDFGKTPVSPAENAVKLTKELLMASKDQVKTI